MHFKFHGASKVQERIKEVIEGFKASQLRFLGVLKGSLSYHAGALEELQNISKSFKCVLGSFRWFQESFREVYGALWGFRRDSERF